LLNVREESVSAFAATAVDVPRPMRPSGVASVRWGDVGYRESYEETVSSPRSWPGLRMKIVPAPPSMWYRSSGTL